MEPPDDERRWWPRVAALAALAGAFALVTSLWLFPHRSPDLDEGVYLVQADALAHGRLFPPAPAVHPEAYAPWLGVARDGHLVVKYTPVHAGMLAAAQRVTGTPRSALPVLAAGLVVAVAGLAREVLGDRRAALGAAALVSLSPMTLLLSATFLSYVGALALSAAGAWALLAGARRRTSPVVALGGLLIGFAVFDRALDGLLFAGAAIGWAWWSRRPPVVRTAAALALGGALPLVLFLAYNRAATGSALRTTFSLFDPLDTLGFGSRRIAPGATIHHFGPLQALAGMGSSLAALVWWAAGGPLLGWLAWKGWRSAPEGRRFAAALAGCFVVGYLGFWGPWFLHLHWERIFLGPFYVLPVVAALAVLAGPALTSRRAGAAVMAVTVLLTAFVVVRVNGRVTQIDAAASPLGQIRTPALVLVQSGQPTLQNPLGRTSNRGIVGGPVVFAVESPATDFDVIDQWPGRTIYLFRIRPRGAGRPPDTALIQLFALPQEARRDDATGGVQVSVDRGTGMRVRVAGIETPVSTTPTDVTFPLTGDGIVFELVDPSGRVVDRATLPRTDSVAVVPMGDGRAGSDAWSVISRRPGSTDPLLVFSDKVAG